MFKELSNDKLIALIREEIKKGQKYDYFLPYFKELSQRTVFIGETILNNFLFRARILDGDELFLHIDKLKYPPKSKSKIGRLNNEGEQVAYMSFNEIAPIAELDISYYEIYCMIKIQYIDKKLLFYPVGLNGKYESNNIEAVKINEFYRELLNSKNIQVYNATIALAHLIFDVKTKTKNKGCLDIENGIIYTSVHDDKSNKNLNNVAVRANTFDKYFKIVDATYKVITYNPKTSENIIYDLNHGTILDDGKVKWNLDYEEMIKSFNEQFSNHIYKVNTDYIIHYKFGGGRIKSSKEDYYLVDFPKGEKKVMKSEINTL